MSEQIAEHNITCISILDSVLGVFWGTSNQATLEVSMRQPGMAGTFPDLVSDTQTRTHRHVFRVEATPHPMLTRSFAPKTIRIYFEDSHWFVVSQLDNR